MTFYMRTRVSTFVLLLLHSFIPFYYSDQNMVWSKIIQEKKVAGQCRPYSIANIRTQLYINKEVFVIATKSKSL